MGFVIKYHSRCMFFCKMATLLSFYAASRKVKELEYIYNDYIKENSYEEFN